MKTALFATGNAHKFMIAQEVCTQFGFDVEQIVLDIAEIQDEDGETIVRDKAQKAYDLVKKPIIVNDDNWIFPGLGGFPGPYMKSINTWFSGEDFLRLTKPLKDRRAILRQYIVFQDAHGQHLTFKDIEGELLPELRGTHKDPNYRIITFDGVHSIAEMNAHGETSISHRKTAWHDMAAWLQENPERLA